MTKQSTNPSLEELRAWAYDERAPEPMEDWDLVLTWTAELSRVRLAIELASDSTCPKWRWFLDWLYNLIERAVREGDAEKRPWLYRSFLDLARGSRDPHVKRWRHRAALLIEDPASFDAVDWYAERDPSDDPD